MQIKNHCFLAFIAAGLAGSAMSVAMAEDRPALATEARLEAEQAAAPARTEANGFDRFGALPPLLLQPAPEGAIQGPFMINGSGATLQEAIFDSPATTNDFVDLDGDGMTTVNSVDFQLAELGNPAPDITPPDNTFLVLTYRVVGSGNGFNETVEWGGCGDCGMIVTDGNGDPIPGNFAVDADLDVDKNGDFVNKTLTSFFSDRSLINRVEFVLAGQTGGEPIVPPAVGDNPGATPFRTDKAGNYVPTTDTTMANGIQIDFSALDVPSEWFVIQGTENQARFDDQPGQAGYGNNPIVGVLKETGAAAGQSNKLKTLGATNTNRINNPDNPDPNECTLVDTPIVLTPVSAPVNFGVGMQEIDMSDLRHLSAAGRRLNGENLMKVNRDSGSGTRNAFYNGICLDPSWGKGENIGLRTTSSAQDLAGPNYQPSNKGGSSRVEGTVKNTRLGIGHTGAERGESKGWLINGEIELLGVVSDLKIGQGGQRGNTAARPTQMNVLENDENGYNIIGPASFVTIGDPMSAPASLGGWGFDPDGPDNVSGTADDEAGSNPSMIPAPRNQWVGGYINNITRSLDAFNALPGDGSINEVIFTPGEFLATQFIPFSAAEFAASPPCVIVDNPQFNPAIKDLLLNPPVVGGQPIFEPVLALPEFQAFGNAIASRFGVDANGNPQSAGIVPQRTDGVDYTDQLDAGNPQDTFVTQGGTVITEGSNPLPRRNLVAGDFNGDAERDINDAEHLLRALGDRENADASFDWAAPDGQAGSAIADAPGADAIIEAIGDFNADGDFDRIDVRYFADGLAIDPLTDTLDRRLGFTTIDNLAATLSVGSPGGAEGVQQIFGTDNFFGTVLATDDLDNSGVIDGSEVSNYEPGDSRCDVSNPDLANTPNFVPGYGPGGFDGDPLTDDLVGADGVVDGSDIDYVYDNFGDWTGPDIDNSLEDAVFMDLACDMNGDLLVNALDVSDVVVDCLNTCFGDVNLDGVADSLDRDVANGNLNAKGEFGWADGDVNGDGAVTDIDLAIINANIDGDKFDPSCPADLTGDGTVDGQDLGLLLLAWDPGDVNPAATLADLSGDGFGPVDGQDLGVLLLAWGPCPQP